VVVDRRDQEHTPAQVLEREHLDDHGQRLDHEDAADQQQQELHVHHQRERTERPAERERSGVAHHDLRGEGVVPEEPDRAADQRRAERRHVDRCDALDAALPTADEREHVHRSERKERNRADAGVEPVDAVGEVRPIRGAGDHEEDERVPEPRQVDLRADERQVHLGGQLAILRDVADHGRDREQHHKLPTA
jgi:hypothetical protein